jgi:hypothetical protein
MLKTFAIVCALFAGTSLLGQNCGSCRLEPVGVAAGQTLRLNVSAASGHSCIAQLGFLDNHGESIGPSSRVSLDAGESTVLDLPSSTQRTEIQPRIVLDPATVASACRANAEVLDGLPASEGDPLGEGIRVHGHWIIDVRNPDGTLATHREFENSLQPSGAAALINSLAGQTITGTWNIQLAGTVCSGGPCFIFENLDTNANGPNIYHGLTISTPITGPHINTLVLNAGFVAPATGIVSTVYTNVNTCGFLVPAANCTYGSSYIVAIGTINFTYYSTDTVFSATTENIGVTGGQLVSVEVVISFS